MSKRNKLVSQDSSLSDSLVYDNKVKPLLGITIRSQMAKCRVIAMVHPPIPDGVVLMLPSDLKASRTFVVNNNEFPLLNDGIVRYIGEPLALLAGQDEAILHSFFHRVRFVMGKLGTDEDSQFTGPFLTRELTCGDDRIAKDVLEVQGTYLTGSQDHGNNDPLEAFAQCVKDAVHIEVKTQWPAHVIQNVASALGIDPKKVTVKAEVTSACQDSQVWFPSLVATHAAILAYKTQQPVLMRYNKKEEFLFSPKRSESCITLRSIVNRNGKIVKFYADVVLQIGAYEIFAEEVLDRTLIGLLLPYQMDFFHFKGYLEKSLSPPRGVIGGLGEGLGVFALEAHVHDICLALQMDPVLWKELYVTRKHPFFQLNDTFLSELIHRVIHITDYSRKYAAYELLKNKKNALKDASRPLRGIGLAIGFHGNGCITNTIYSTYVEAQLASDGKLFLYIPLVTANQRLILFWKELAVKDLQIAPQNVLICPYFTGDHPSAGPSFASRAFEIVQHLIISVCEEIAQRRFHQPLPIIAHKAFHPPKTFNWASAPPFSQPFLSLSWGAAVVEVEVSPLLAEVTLRKVTLLVDIGPRIDEVSARNTLTESVCSAIGWVLTEKLQWEFSTINNTYFLGYRLPRLCELPEIDIHFFQRPHSRKSKGLGNLGSVAVAPAILTAIRQAMNCRILNIPLSRKVIDDILGGPLLN